MKFVKKLLFLLCIIPISATLAMLNEEGDLITSHYAQSFQEEENLENAFNPSSQTIKAQRSFFYEWITGPQNDDLHIVTHFKNDAEYIEKVENIIIDTVTITSKKTAHKTRTIKVADFSYVEKHIEKKAKDDAQKKTLENLPFYQRNPKWAFGFGFLSGGLVVSASVYYGLFGAIGAFLTKHFCK